MTHMVLQQVRTRGRRHEPEAGLTLVELMISLLLASMLTGGLMYMMAGQASTYRQQIGTVSLQESLWGAMEYLQRQVRSAGFGFASNCHGPRGRARQWDPAAGCLTTPSRAVGFQAFNDCNLLTTAIAACPDGSGSDSFVVTAASPIGESALLGQNVLRSDDPLFLNSSGAIQAGDMLVISEPGAAWCTLVKASSLPIDAGNMFTLSLNPDGVYNPAPGCSIFPTAPRDGYGVRAQVARIPAGSGPRYFAIDRSRGTPRLVTWTSFVEPSTDTANKLETVAYGIEDLQLSFACDDDDDGLLEGNTDSERRDDDWAYNIASEVSLPVCDPASIGMIRLTLIARSDSADPDLESGFRPAAEDHPAGTPADDKALSGDLGTFKRRLLTTVVSPQNL